MNDDDDVTGIYLFRIGQAILMNNKHLASSLSV